MSRVRSDHGLVALSSRQHGLLLTAQLSALGLGREMIRDRVRQGRLFRVHREVYAVGSPKLTRIGSLLAAVLTCGDGALLTAGGALELWGIEAPLANPIDVLTPKQRRARTGIRPHRTTSLQALDLCAIDIVPLAAPARSLLDYATVAAPDAIEAALDGLRTARLLRSGDLDELRRRSSGHRGWGALNRLLKGRKEPGFSRSRAETMTIDLIRAAGLPLPRRNARVGRWEADLLWPDHGVVVEFDSWRYHSGRASFERDRAKSTELEAQAITTIRITWRQLTAQPEWVVAQLAAVLARRSPSG